MFRTALIQRLIPDSFKVAPQYSYRRAPRQTGGDGGNPLACPPARWHDRDHVQCRGTTRAAAVGRRLTLVGGRTGGSAWMCLRSPVEFLLITARAIEAVVACDCDPGDSHRYRSTNAATGDMWGLSDLLALVSRDKGAGSTDDSGDGDCDDWY